MFQIIPGWFLSENSLFHLSLVLYLISNFLCMKWDTSFVLSGLVSLFLTHQ